MEIYNTDNKAVINKLIDDINQLYGGEAITAEYVPTGCSSKYSYMNLNVTNGWFFVLFGRVHHEGSTPEAIKYLREVKSGIKKYIK